MADLSLNQVVPRVRDLLGENPSVITSTTTGTGTSIAVSDASALSLGDILEWQTGTVGYEQMLITVDPAGVSPVTVQRGYNGTTAESHTSGDSLFIGPNFTGRQIQQALAAAIRALWPYAYVVTSVDLGAYTTGKIWYDLVGFTQRALGMVGVRQTWGSAPSKDQGDFVAFGTRGGLPVVWDFTIDTGICASGAGVRFPSGLYDQSASAAHPFARVATPILGVNDIPDDERWPVADCISYFAAGRLLGASEIPRVTSGGDLESAGTVGTGARTQTGVTFLAQARSLLQAIGHRYRNFYHPLDVQ